MKSGPTSAPQDGAARRKKVLFICSGNYYRSRLAEALFNHEAAAAGLAWDAVSRGMLKTGELRGMSEHAVGHLKESKLHHLAEEPRDPVGIDVEDLTEADLVIGLCREEHQPMVEQKFLALARALHKAGRIRYWNVYDIPARPRAMVRLLGGGHKGPSQPAESGTEHITLAIKALIAELSGS